MNTENSQDEHSASKQSNATTWALLTAILSLIIFLSLVYLIPRRRPGGGDIPHTRLLIDALDNGLKQYRADHGILPSQGSPEDPKDPASNIISRLYNNLQGKYVVFREHDIGVLDPATGKARQATAEEIKDPAIDKLILDIWGQPLIVRENRSKKVKAPHMRNKDSMDIYSVGENGVDDTVLMKSGEENDDIGNW